MPGERWRPVKTIRAAAYHEAGHAVASWRLGDGIGAVTIEPGIDRHTREPNWGSFTLRRGGHRSLASGWGHRHLVMVLAGLTAQRAHDARSCVLSCAGADLRSAHAFAAVMTRSRASARALLLWAHAEARALVQNDWHLVEVLARALLDATTLAGEAATEILVEAERAERSASSALRRDLLAEPVA